MLNALAQDTIPHVPGQLLVMIKENQTIDRIVSNFNHKNSPNSLNIISCPSDILHIWLLGFSGNETGIIEKLNSESGVIACQFNHYTRQRINPNDTYFSSMWDMHNTGQSGGVIDADIDAPEAWNIATGGLTATGDTIVVAVIDGGFQLTHTDLKFWKNFNEIPGNGIDDDGNGYIDDRNGWNAINNNANIGSDQHGTHVAGTVGAKGNNNMGTMGVNWNVQVMAVQGATTVESEAVIAYTYILKNRRLYDQSNGQKGAFVVSTNASFGVDYGQPANFPLWCAIYDSLGTCGILNAGATANLNINVDTQGDIPTACASDFMISVTNTTRMDAKNTGAAYGLTTIDLGAPGTNIYSTVPTNSWAQNGWTGTSMATPHVAGTVALMLNAACPKLIQDYKQYPDSIGRILKSYILQGTDPISALNNITVTGGRLNLFNTLQLVQSYNCSVVGSIENESNSYSAIQLFPNPSNGGWVELHYFSPDDLFDIVVRNTIGQEVLRKTRFNHQGNNAHLLDISELSNGVYYVSIESKKKSSQGRKLVVTGN